MKLDKQLFKLLLKPFFVSIGISAFLLILIIPVIYPIAKLLLPLIEKFTDVEISSIALYIYYQLLVMSFSIVNAFYIDKIVSYINKDYNLPTREVSVFKSIYWSLKGIGYFLLVFPFTFFLLFIPGINIFYQVFLWTLINKKSLVFDSSAMFCDVKEIEKDLNKKLWLIIFISSFIYFIPVLNLFGYSLQLVILTHYILNYCKGKK